MPKIRWHGLPPALRDYLFERLRERHYSELTHCRCAKRLTGPPGWHTMKGGARNRTCVYVLGVRGALLQGKLVYAPTILNL